MIMYFDTEPTNTAMIRSWRSNNLARSAVGKRCIITLPTLLQDAPTFLVHCLYLLLGHYLEGVQAEEGLYGCLLILSITLPVEFLHDFVWCLVSDSILFVVFYLFRSDFRNNAGFSSRAEIEDAKNIDETDQIGKKKECSTNPTEKSVVSIFKSELDEN